MRPPLSVPSVCSTAEATYSSGCPNVGFSATIDELNTGAICASGTGMIDNLLATGNKSGYAFTYAAATNGAPVNTAYTITAVPQKVGVTGQRGFFSDQTGVIRYTLDGSAPTNAASALQ